MLKTACIAVVRDEERHIAEWVEFQFAIGFDTVILFDNLSTDGTKAVLTPLTANHDLRLLDWPETTASYQTAAYEQALRQFGAEFTWMAFFDADEFLVLDIPLAEMLARHEASEAIAVNWAMFGAAGRLVAPAGGTLENYLYRSAPDFFPNRHVKTIIRPRAAQGCSNPHMFKTAAIYRDLAGREVQWHIPGATLAVPDYQGGKLHHYFTRSLADYMDKLRRGYRDITRGFEDFANHDRNEIFDDSALFARAAAASAAPPAQKRERCAVVLVVKDEASDILSWLAWYHLLGFDACIVFDDESTDGTWEILQKAAAVQEIRLERTKGPRDAFYILRQEFSYKFALTTYRHEFDWLAFFDADEYLSLRQDDTIQSFLARFPGADEVAVNWCNYGSSGHVQKPDVSPIEAYTWHGNEHQPVNRHVKSIVRPSKVGPVWVGVHCFDTAPERSVLAEGQPISWGPTPGIIDRDPDWNLAKLMHYQCRSRAHFEDRIHKRPDLASHAGLFALYDMKEVEDVSPLRFAPALHEQIKKLQGDVGATPGVISDLIFDIGMSEGNDTAFYLAKGFRVVGVEADAAMYYSLCERFAAEISDGRLIIYNFAAGENNGEIVEFFHHDQHQGLSGLSHRRSEFQEGNFQSYFVSTVNWQSLAPQHGVPYYLKVDIEDQETAFLKSLAGQARLPVYVSVECHQIAPVQQLYDLGYRRFKLVNQNPPGGFQLPALQKEGTTMIWNEFVHSSGPFGQDLPEGPWLDFAAFEAAWTKSLPDYAFTWYDCHAWMPV